MRAQQRKHSTPPTRGARAAGTEVLNLPLMNKGTAFTEDERSDLGLRGLLPPHVETLDEQVTRAYEAYTRKTDDLERHIYLRALQDTNEVLFYRLLLDHIEEMTPMVYTPVVALACQQFSHIYRRPRGLFISYPLRDSIATLLQNRPNPEVDVIVVTDGERILGIGDQGAGGLGIPIGKLSLYTLVGGIRPERTLPIVLDVGTNNAEPLKDQQIVMLGAGSAGIGVADFLRAAMRDAGLSDEDARRRFWIVDKDGLLHSGRTDLTAEQRVYAQPQDRVSAWSSARDGIGLAGVIAKINATILIGLSTARGAFSESIVREMARKVERPIIFPLSNPTSKSEATADDLIRWTDGRALVATGSPFAPVPYGGRQIPIAQCNNIYIFPAMGLGVVASRARRVTDAMILAAARALGEKSPALTDPSASLLPALPQLREVAAHIATAVGRQAQRDGVAPKTSDAELGERVTATQWTPAYPSFAPSKK